MVTFMTSDHLGTQIRNQVAGVEGHRDGYGFGLTVAVRLVDGVAAVPRSPATTPGTAPTARCSGTTSQSGSAWSSAPARPGEIRKLYREQMAALVYGAMTESRRRQLMRGSGAAAPDADPDYSSSLRTGPDDERPHRVPDRLLAARRGAGRVPAGDAAAAGVPRLRRPAQGLRHREFSRRDVEPGLRGRRAGGLVAVLRPASCFCDAGRTLALPDLRARRAGDGRRLVLLPPAADQREAVLGPAADDVSRSCR